MIEGVATFLFWTLMLYYLHRLAHVTPWLKDIHHDHHIQVYFNRTGWSWKNLVLWVDTWRSTADQWIIEVIPTLVLCALTGHWWIGVFYYVWAAFIQEAIEHNRQFDIFPMLTSGKWHLVHHDHPRSNFGIFTPLWDILFDTYQAKTA